MKTTAKKRKEIYAELWEKKYTEDHLNKIDALARELGILIPKSYLVDFHAEDQEKILRLLLEAERNRLLSRSWLLSTLALIVSIISACAAWIAVFYR